MRIQQRGQAMAEFVAVMSVFIIMLLAIPYLAKLGDIRQNMEQAARHAAWERTVWLHTTQKADKGAVVEDEAHVQESVVHHFFTGKIERAEFNEGAMTPQQTYWHNVNSVPMIDKIDDIKVTTSNDDTPGAVFQTILAPILNIFTILGTAANASNGNGAIFAVDSKGLYRADVTAQVNDQFGGKLNFKSSVTLLGNEWYGGGKKRTEKKVQGMVATAAMNSAGMQAFIQTTKDIDKVFNIFGFDPLLEFGLVFGKATDDGLPDDRKELIKQWKVGAYDPAPTPSERFKEYAPYQYIPSAEAVAAMPLHLGVIDPTNNLTQSLP